MKLTLQHIHLRSTDELDSVIEDRILALSSRVRIDEAVIRLERWRALRPSFRVQAHLVTPGPDLLAEGRGYTIRAAVDEAIARLEARLAGRERNRARQARSNLQKPAYLRQLSPRAR